MPLSIFNLAKTIETYNKERQHNYAPYEDFGFAYFEKTMLAQTNAAITIINTGLDRYHWTPQERAFLKKRKQYFRQYGKYFNDQVEAPLRIAIEDDVGALEYQQKIQFWNWINALHAQLSKPETWEAWLKTVPLFNRARLLELKALWEKSAPFACHTNTSLYTSAKKLLPSLIEHHSSARRQLFWSFWEVPSDVSYAYQKYLDDFSEEANKVKPALAAHMLARLQVWGENKSTEGNTLIHLHQELQKIGVISKEEKIPSHSETLTAKQFNYFHHYIERHGDDETKKQLQSLSWLKQDNLICPTESLSTASTSFLVPKEFMQDVPRKLRKPAWLHRGHNLRHTFFQDKGLLFAALKTFPDMSNLQINLRDISNVFTHLNDLHHKQQKIQESVHELTLPVYKDLGYFQGHAKGVLQKWQNYLTDYHSKVIESKLHIAEKIAAQLQQCDPIEATLHAWSACCFIKKLIKTLHNDLRECPQEVLQQRLMQVEKSLTNTLSNYRILQLIVKLSAGKIISQEKMDYLRDVIDAIHLNDESMYAHFQEICQPHFSQMRKILDYELRANPSELHNPKFHIDRILALHLVLNQCSDEKTRQEHQQRISEKLPKYFLKYLETLLRCGQNGERFALYQPAINAFEQVILALDTGLLFANKSLSTHVKDLQMLREDALNKRGSWSLVQARCQALAQGLLSLYLDKRIQKDLATFDRQLFDFIKNDTELPFDETTVDELQKLSDHQIEKNLTHIEELSLTPEQKTLVGLNGGSCAYIRELLELRRTAYSQQRQILMPSISPSDKSQHIEILATNLKKSLQQNPKQSVYAFIGYTRSGRRELFTKSYFDTQLLNLESKSPPQPSTVNLTK